MKRSVFLYGDVAASDREVFKSELMTSRFYLHKFVVRFAPNVQRTLKVRLWVGPSAPPDAQNMIAQRGNVDYVVGDGNEVVINVGQWFDGGIYLYADGENTVAAVRTVDVEAAIEEV